MKALSIRQPWAWLILNGGKDIENRAWKTNFRGRVLVHAAKGITRAEYDSIQAGCFPRGHFNTNFFPAFELLERGGIIGSVEITDCVTQSGSPWFFGPFGFVLTNSKPLPFIPLKGQLGFFEVDHALLNLVDFK